MDTYLYPGGHGNEEPNEEGKMKLSLSEDLGISLKCY